MRVDRIRNEAIRNKVKVSPIEGKMREIILNSFGHVKKRSVNAPMRTCKRINLLHYQRGRDSQRKVQVRWLNRI